METEPHRSSRTRVLGLVAALAGLGGLACLGLSSCASGVCVSKGFSYPPGYRAARIDNGDGTCHFDGSGAVFLVDVTSLGTVDRHDKTHWHSEVTFSSHGQDLGGRYTYDFTTFQLAEELAWLAPGDCTLRFYALPDGVFEGDQDAKARRKEVLRRRYRFDRKTNAFLEVF